MSSVKVIFKGQILQKMAVVGAFVFEQHILLLLQMGLCCTYLYVIVFVNSSDSSKFQFRCELFYEKLKILAKNKKLLYENTKKELDIVL